MSNQPPNPTIGGTLAGGIQDVSAILPIIGTAQCESHVGSALRGGYLYAAAAPLSIFGSLGIVKAGVAVLISSIAIPKFWVSGRDLGPSGPTGKVKQSMFLGARMLEDAGFKLQGDVAALIGMDGTRFKAESRLIQMLEEKHIDNPTNVSITWKSKEWNIMLVLFTIVAAAMSGVPYFALLLGPESWRPTTHLPWLFPFLRTVGSCLASVCCQFIIQSRVISSMKNRILFMAIHRKIANQLSTDNKANLDDWLKYHLQWDSNLPAEQCIRNLQQAFSFYDNHATLVDVVEPTDGHVSIEMEHEKPPPTRWTLWIYRRSSTFLPPPPPPPKPLFQDAGFRGWMFDDWFDKHLPSRKRDRVIAFMSWIVLCLSLPATVAGYVGCFTLVGATPSPGNGPLVWLGLEAALSVIRILIWAWNPKFDEDTDVTAELKLGDHRPSDWTEELNGFIHDLEIKKSKHLVLLPEQQFLEQITAYTGPLDRFQRSDNIALYFTPMADDSVRLTEVGSEYISLLITVIDFNTRIGVAMLQLAGSFYYFDADVKYEAALTEINATVYSTMRNIHPWQTQVRILFNSLEQHYASLVSALNPTHRVRGRNIAKLEWKWDLSLKPALTTSPSPPLSFGHDLLYPDQRYEHNLKAKLIQLWSRWIVVGMEYRGNGARNSDRYEVFGNESSEKAKWELTERDRLLAWEWAIREQVLVTCSLELEDILRAKMEKSITQARKDGRLEVWMRTGFEISRRRRLQNDKGEAMKAMKVAMNRASAVAERERRSWKEQGRFAPKWQEGIQLIDALWSEGIMRGPTPLDNTELAVEDLARMNISFDADTTRDNFVGQVKHRFTHWRSQYESERREMEATIKRIRRADGQEEQLDIAYKYPEPDKQATFKFASLGNSTSKGKVCSAIVYDAVGCSSEAVCDVIKKSTTRSVIHVDPKIVPSIPPNDHLLFLSCFPEGEEPAFVEHNRDQWWDQQTTNSALFYFTPFGLDNDSCYVFSGPIAQIFIFLATPSRVRLRLLHCAVSKILPELVSIQENGKNICTLSDGIPEHNLKLQSLELGELRPGRHELQVVPKTHAIPWYYLGDILVEFLDDPAQKSSAFEDSDIHTDEIRPTIGAVCGAEKESSNSTESPLLHPDKQDTGLDR